MSVLFTGKALISGLAHNGELCSLWAPTGADVEQFGFSLRVVTGPAVSQRMSIDVYLADFVDMGNGPWSEASLIPALDMGLGTSDVLGRIWFSGTGSGLPGEITMGLLPIGGETTSELADAPTIQHGIMDWELPLHPTKGMRLRVNQGFTLQWAGAAMDDDATAEFAVWLRVAGRANLRRVFVDEGEGEPGDHAERF